MRLSGISRIIEAEAGAANRGLNNSRYPAKTKFNNYFIIHMELFIFYSLYKLFFGIILFYFLYKLYFGIILFYSLCENKKLDLLVLQSIIRKRDVIITNTKKYYLLRARSPF